MAWTAPRTWTTGEVVTASHMNTHIRDNLLATAPAVVSAAADVVVGTGANAVKRLAKGSASQVLAMNSSATDLEWTDPSGLPYAVTSGSSSAYTATISPGPSSYYDGFSITIKPHTDCVAAPTLSVNGLGAKALKDHYKNAFNAGELAAGQMYFFIYDGTDFLACSAGGLDLFFGDGSDGALSTTGDVVIPYVDSTRGSILIKQYTSLTVNAGHTLSGDVYPNLGLIIYCTGDVTVSGTIHQNKKAGYDTLGHITPYPITKQMSYGPPTITKYYQIASVLQKAKGGGGGGSGAGGGYDGTHIAAGGGSPSSYHTAATLYGGVGYGGGGGAAGPDGIGGVGGNGTGTRATTPSKVDQTFYLASGSEMYSVASGYGSMGAGGEGAVYADATSGAITVYQGQGGYCDGAGGGGGGGVCANTTRIGNEGGYGGYAGGFLCIIARGNVTINSGGVIEANGADGGDGGDAKADFSSAGGGGGGGGAGGGVIAIFYGGTYTNNGTVQALGGAGGLGGAGAGALGGDGEDGYPGANGTIITQSITPTIGGGVGDYLLVDGVNGDDLNDGSPEYPWKTIGKAASTAVAGETVYIKGGTYEITAPILCQNSGTAGSFITFKAYPSETPIIDARGITSYDDSYSAFDFNGQEYIELNGITVQHAGGLNGASGYYCGIGQVWWTATPLTGCKHIVIDGCTTRYTGTNGIGIYGGADITIQNCTVEYANQYGTNQEALTLNNVDTFLIYNNTLRYNGKENIDCKGGCVNGVISYNTITAAAGPDCIYIDAGYAAHDTHDIEIHHNYCDGNDYTVNGIEIGNEDAVYSVYNIEIHNNEIIDCNTSIDIEVGYMGDYYYDLSYINIHHNTSTGAATYDFRCLLPDTYMSSNTLAYNIWGSPAKYYWEDGTGGWTITGNYPT